MRSIGLFHFGSEIFRNDRLLMAIEAIASGQSDAGLWKLLQMAADIP